MKFRTLALTLAASLTLASAAGAVEHKHHPRMEDRQMSAHSDMHVYRYDQTAPNGDTLDPLNRDPLTSANGS